MTTKTATRTDYGRRIARAIALITADPRQNPSLEALAAAAAFSPYHFHRIYRAITGETPAETLARERLSHAAALLLREAMPVAAVARACGYGSAAAFTRAFRAAYGAPPAAYRAAGGIGAPRPTPRKIAEEPSMFDVTIQPMPALHVAALAHRGRYAEIGNTFTRLKAWAGARGLLAPGARGQSTPGARGQSTPGARFLGLYHDDPRSVPASALRSDAAVTVPPGTAVEPGMRLLDLAAGRAAVLVFKGPYAELERAYDWLYRDWLPASGQEPADAPVREEYLNDCRGLPPAEWLTAIMVPLR